MLHLTDLVERIQRHLGVRPTPDERKLFLGQLKRLIMELEGDCSILDVNLSVRPQIEFIGNRALEPQTDFERVEILIDAYHAKLTTDESAYLKDIRAMENLRNFLGRKAAVKALEVASSLFRDLKKNRVLTVGEYERRLKKAEFHLAQMKEIMGSRMEFWYITSTTESFD